MICAKTGQRLLEWMNSGVNPEQRAKELLIDALADIAKAPDMQSLHSAFNAAKAIALGFDELIGWVVKAKDKRKTELTPLEQQA